MDTGDAERGGYRAFVHDPPSGQGQILAMREHRQTERRRLFHGFQHSSRRGNRAAVVRHSDRARRLQRGKIGQPLTAQRRGNGGHRIHTRRGGGRPFHNVSDNRRIITHRRSIGHTRQGGNAACRRSGTTGVYIFFICLPRVAEVNVHIHQPRRADQPAGFQHFRLRHVDRGSDLGNSAVPNQHIQNAVDFTGRINHPCAANQSHPAVG